MTRFKKTLLSVVVLIALAAVVSAGIVYHTLRQSLPDHTAAFTDEIVQGVSVSRDARGVAHIRAKTLEDLFFSQGYIHADERLWQMEFNRRVVQGRLSEILGADLAGADRFLRTLGLYRIAERVVDKTSPAGQAIMADYIRGINARLKEGRLPPEMRILGIAPDPWEKADVAGILALMAYNLGSNWQEESLRMSLQEALDPALFSEIMPPYEDWETPVIWKRDQAPRTGTDTPAAHSALDKIAAFLPRPGSNAWVLSPDKWAGDAALLANDPHLSMGLPSIWFENSLESEGELKLYGWSIPGSPGVVIGHNEKIAWGNTNIGDTQDLFLEKRDPDDPRRFMHDDEWYDAVVIEEEIRIKGEAEPDIHEVIITKNGPLISENPAMSLKWTAYHIEKSAVDAIMGINRAQNWDDFCDALAHYTLPPQNIVYADVHGNIGFKTVGTIPIRKKGEGLMPSPGWDDAHGWEGFIPHDELPELFNPPQGYVITANHRVAGDDYPHVIAIDDASPYRMMRLKAVLSSGNAFTLGDMKVLQTDWHNMHAVERLPLWLEQVEAHAGRFQDRYDDMQMQGLTILNEWVREPVSLPEKAAPAIYAAWYLNLMEDVFREKMGDPLYMRFIDKGYMAYKALDYLLMKEDSEWFEGGLAHTLAQSYRRTMDELAATLGPNMQEWRWQDLQTISFDHIMGENRLLAPLVNRGPYPYGGDYETVGRAAYKLNNPFNVSFAAGLRFIAVMTPDIEAHAVIAGGQSGHFMADHYDDQLETWLDGGYYRLTVPPE